MTKSAVFTEEILNGKLHFLWCLCTISQKKYFNDRNIRPKEVLQLQNNFSPNTHNEDNLSKKKKIQRVLSPPSETAIAQSQHFVQRHFNGKHIHPAETFGALTRCLPKGFQKQDVSCFK